MKQPRRSTLLMFGEDSFTILDVIKEIVAINMKYKLNSTNGEITKNIIRMLAWAFIICNKRVMGISLQIF